MDLTNVPPLARDRVAARLARARARTSPGVLAGTAVLPETKAPAGWISSAQLRMWFLDQLSPHTAAYNIPVAWRLRGPLDITALGDALRDVVDRSPVLRTSYVAELGRPVPVVHEATRLRLRQRSGEAGWLDAEAARPFVLEAELPIRAAIAATGPETHEFTVVVHHIAADGWSIGLIADELSAAYAARVAGRRLPAPSAIAYPQAAHRQEQALDGERLARGVAHWRERLAGAPPALRLPVEWQRPAKPGAAGRIWTTGLPSELTGHVRRAAVAERATPFMVLLQGFAAACARWTAAEDIVLGTAVFGRDAPELADVVGCFINSLPVRVRVPAEDTGRELIRRVRETLLRDLEHSDVPYQRIVDEVASSGAPLFEIMVVAGNVPRRGLGLVGVEAAAVPVDPGAAKLDLSLSVDDVDGRTELAFTYRAELFSEALIARLARQYLTLLANLLRDPERPVGELAMLDDEEARALVAAHRPSPDGTVLERFEAQVRARPGAPAVTDAAGGYTYQQLDTRARAISAALIKAGVAPGAVVGLLAERNADSVAGILGILRAGAAYAPVDPEAPAARVRDLLGSAEPAAVVGPPRLRALAGRTPFVPWDAAGDPAGEQAGELVGASPEDLAYVLFTSGSTGQPKGVEVEHRQLHQYITAILDRLDVVPGERFALVSTLAADLGHTSVFGALCSGGVLRVCGRDEAVDATVLAAAFRSAPPHHLKLTPSHLAALLDAAGSDERARDLLPRRSMVLGGETLGWPLVDRVRGLAPCLRIVNHYGPTETTVGAMTWGVPETSQRPAMPPIGVPLPHCRASVRDAAGAPVPVGVPGELYIGGAAVARGYRGDPELTAARFVHDPYGLGRLYRTGDRARLRADGSYEFLGRADDQVKIRGYRVEPGEIVAALRSAPGVRDAAVVTRPEAEELLLVGYVVGVDDTGPIQAWLRERLPRHLVPSALVPLSALPLTANGKLDRSALPPPAPTAPAIPVTRAPRSEVERALAGIWEDLLAIQVSVDDDFFALGGHSLLSTRMAARIRADLGIEVPLRRLFELRTLDALARYVDRIRWAAGSGPNGLDPGQAAVEDGVL